MEYDDDVALTAYVWKYHLHLMSDAERRVALLVMARAKVAIGSASFARFLERRHGLIGDPEVERALAEGLENYRLRIARRVLAEHTDRVFVNRCPQCGRIVRTPRARQCFWCRHAWHGERPSPQ